MQTSSFWGLTERWRRGPCGPRGCGGNQDTCRALRQRRRDLLTNASCRRDVYTRGSVPWPDQPPPLEAALAGRAEARSETQLAVRLCWMASASRALRAPASV